MKPRSPLPIFLAAVAGLVVGGGAVGGIMAASGGKPKKAAQVPACASVAPVASAAAPASGSASAVPAPRPAPSKGSLAERASHGDAEAKKQIEARPVEQRTAEEALALARGHGADKRTEILELGRKIVLLPQYATGKEGATRIKELTLDREIASEMLEMLITLPSPSGPDMLYQAFQRTKGDTAHLAEDLLYSKDVRPKASPALAVVLDLRRAVQAQSCEDAKKVLESVKRDGDRRVLIPMAKLYDKHGCGEKKRDDCWACLRDPDIVKEATKEAAKRAAP